MQEPIKVVCGDDNDRVIFLIDRECHGSRREEAAHRQTADRERHVRGPGQGCEGRDRRGHGGRRQDPATPGPDPMCMDKNALDWAHAWIGHTTPAPGKVGFMYMLAGGTDASNTDPYAAKPDAKNNWIKTGPHVMIVGADASFYDMYPKSAKPDTSVPYVMFPGTPYQHLMAPVK